MTRRTPRFPRLTGLMVDSALALTGAWLYHLRERMDVRWCAAPGVLALLLTLALINVFTLVAGTAVARMLPPGWPC